MYRTDSSQHHSGDLDSSCSVLAAQLPLRMSPQVTFPAWQASHPPFPATSAAPAKTIPNSLTCSGRCPACSKGPPHAAPSLCCGHCWLPAAPCSFTACQLHTQALAPGIGITQPPGLQDGGVRSSQWAETRSLGDGCAEQTIVMVQLWWQGSLSSESLLLQKMFSERYIVCKGWLICFLSEDCWGLYGGRSIMIVANSTHIPPLGSLLTSEDHYSIYCS